jgi:hypothetical protein
MAQSNEEGGGESDGEKNRQMSGYTVGYLADVHTSTANSWLNSHHAELRGLFPFTARCNPVPLCMCVCVQTHMHVCVPSHSNHNTHNSREASCQIPQSYGWKSSHAPTHVCVAQSGHWGVSWASSVPPPKTGTVPQSGHNFTNHPAIWHCTIFTASQCWMLCSCAQHYPMCQSFSKCLKWKHNATTSHVAH